MMSEPTATKSGRVTLKDIARLAGVSVSTASTVLSGKGAQSRISAEVERRVREVANQHDYTPNLLVRSLQRGRTHVLSFYNAFGSHSRGDLYMDQLSSALMRAAGQRGYDVLTHCDFTRPVEETYRLLNGGLADGLIFFGPNTGGSLLPLLRTSRLPTVILNQVDEEGVLSSVSDDLRDGMRQVVEDLTRLGHRRIAALADRTHTDAAARIEALRAYLALHDIALPERRVVPVYAGDPLRTEEALRFLLGDPEPPTALFCWHDRVGYEMLEACERLGIAVPDRLSLVGYDGLHWPSTSQHVLASVHVSLDTLAERAVRLLDEIIVGEAAAPVFQVYPISLSPGTTLAPPPGSQR